MQSLNPLKASPDVLAALHLLRALGVLLLLAVAATLHAATPAPTAAATVPSTSGAFTDVAPRAAAVAAKAAITAPLTFVECLIDIRGDSKGGISTASMKCTGSWLSLVKIGVHPRLFQPFKQSFQGVVWDPRCAVPECLITFCDNTTVGVKDSIISGVTSDKAPQLEAVVCVVGSTRVVLRNTTVSSNKLTAVIAWHEARLHVLGSTLVGNTGYSAPGGIMAINKSTVVVDEVSVVAGNWALNASGGGILVMDDAVFVLSGASRVVNNTSMLQAAGGLGVGGRAEAHIGGYSAVCNNTSLGDGGGGILVAGHAQLAVVEGTVVCNNVGGKGVGGLFVVQNATATIRNATISGNIAYGAGGGIAVGGYGRLAVYDTVIANNSCVEIPPDTVGGGAVLATGNSVVQLLSNTRLLGNQAIGLAGGALALAESARLTVAAGVMLIDNKVVANKSSQIVPFAPDGIVLQSSELDLQPGVVGQDGLLTKCSRSIVLQRRPCGVGEFDGGGGSACLCCPSFTYNFEPNVTSCQQCPANAQCRGDVVSPVAGYWHSSQRSVQIHRCPIAKSCQQGGACLAGHTGNLCGECSKGYGTTTPLRCGMCMKPWMQLSVYVVLVSVTVLFVTTTVHFTWQDNKAGDRSLRPSDLIKVLVQFLQYVVILSSISVPWPAFLAGVFTAATIVFGVGSGQALSLDCWLPQYLPIKLPLALQRQLSVFVGALVVALACIVLMHLLHVCNRVWHACRYKPRRGRSQPPAPRLHFWSRLRVTLLVTAYFAYPTLVKAALSFFACLRIDVAGKQPHPEYSTVSHAAGYWVGAIQQECFAGWHRTWALAFGLPAVMVLCIGVPLCLHWFMRRSKAKMSDATFREHYGFLFRNYIESKQWWEAVWAGQTVLLTAVSVFHFTIQAYYALLVMQLILLASAAAQVIARPYAQLLLHRLHLASTCCLYFIVWLSLALFSASVDADAGTLYRAHTAFGAVMVLIACSFVVWCLVIIVRAASPVLRDFAAWLEECTGGVASSPPSISSTSSSVGHQQSTSQQLPIAPAGAVGRRPAGLDRADSV
jgi:hypothetical protein